MTRYTPFSHITVKTVTGDRSNCSHDCDICVITSCIIELPGCLKPCPKMLILLLMSYGVLMPMRQLTCIVCMRVSRSNDIHDPIIDGYVYVPICFEAAHTVVDSLVVLSVQALVSVGSFQNHHCKFVPTFLIRNAVLSSVRVKAFAIWTGHS